MTMTHKEALDAYSWFGDFIEESFGDDSWYALELMISAFNVMASLHSGDTLEDIRKVAFPWTEMYAKLREIADDATEVGDERESASPADHPKAEPGDSSGDS